jgi:hypothetical protein
VITAHRDDDREAGRDAYAAARLTQRRSVRLALALGQGLAHGPRAARELWGAGAAVLDLPGPRLPARPRYPHLRVAHLSADPVTRGVIPGARVTPATWRTVLRRDRPELVLLDAIEGWKAGELHALLAATSAAAYCPPAMFEQAVAAGVARDRIRTLEPDDEVLWFDSRVHSPVGLPPVPDGRILPLGTAPPTDPGADRGTVRLAEPAADVAGQAVRIVSCLARGTPVVVPDGGPLGDGLRRLLGPVADEIVTPPETCDDRARQLCEPEHWERTSVRVRRHLHRHHAREAHVDLILARCGLDAALPPRISVLLSTRRSEHLVHGLEQIGRQDHPDVEVVLVLHGIPRPDDRALGAVRRPLTAIEVASDRPLGAALDAGLDRATGSLVAKMDDDDHYGSGHLSDLVVALQYSGADIVGRWANAVYLERQGITVHGGLDRQERWATHLPGATMLIHGEVLRRLRWRHVPNAVDTELIRATVSAGGSAYSTHRFGFIRSRHTDHTFARSNRSFRRGRVHRGLDTAALEV